MTKKWHLRSRTLEISSRALVMGIVNVTPDSFSDGGRYSQSEAAVAHGLRLVEEGADLLDIGGESTRPGATPVDVAQELRRVADVVETLGKLVAVPISVDTSKAAVARACLQAGAHVINDVTALTGDPAMLEVVLGHGAGVILMHMQGTPATMQLAPHYGDVVAEIRDYLHKRVEAVTAQGLQREAIVIDPGIGFGKTHAHNLELLARLREFQTLGLPLCLGASRKGFLGKITGRSLEERLAGNLAVVGHALTHGAAQIVRVHDVAQTRDVVLMFEALAQYGG